MTLLHVSQGVATFSESETRKCIACVAVQYKRGIRRATLCGMQESMGCSPVKLAPSRGRVLRSRALLTTIRHTIGIPKV
jgi:hypothetical protein